MTARHVLRPAWKQRVRVPKEETSPPVETFYMLKEDGDALLKEDGDHILKEDAP